MNRSARRSPRRSWAGGTYVGSWSTSCIDAVSTMKLAQGLQRSHGGRGRKCALLRRSHTRTCVHGVRSVSRRSAVLHGLARLLPSADARRHHVDVRVAELFRRDRGGMAILSKLTGAVKDEHGPLVAGPGALGHLPVA